MQFASFSAYRFSLIEVLYETSHLHRELMSPAVVHQATVAEFTHGDAYVRPRHSRHAREFIMSYGQLYFNIRIRNF